MTAYQNNFLIEVEEYFGALLINKLLPWLRNSMANTDMSMCLI